MTAEAAELPVMPLLREAAGRFVMPRFQKAAREQGLRYKPGHDPVTLADTETQAFLVERLGALLPGVPCIGEESYDAAARARLRAAHDVLLVDPLDGTRAFVSGDPRFSLLAALCSGGRPVAAWMLFPALGVAVEGRLGSGLRVEGARLRARAESAGDRYRCTWLPDVERLALERRFEAAGWTRDEPTSTEFLRLLEGRTRSYYCTHTTPWDTAPGVLLVREAGGFVERCDGGAWTPRDEAGALLFAPDERVFAETIQRFGLDRLSPARSPLETAGAAPA